jgi:hypothetical protein
MEQEKQQYINDNLIEKGYNPDDLFNYCYKLKGIGIENLSLNELKNIIENFKNEQLIISLQSLKNKKEKKSTPFEILYSDCEFISETAKQPETKMMEFEKEKKKLNIKIIEPKKEKGSLFSKDQMTFQIVTEELNSKVKRNYSDFEWYKNQLNLRYPFILVPPLIKDAFYSNINLSFFSKKKDEKNNIEEQENLNMRIRYLNKFMNGILRKKILRTSPITYEFLVLEQKDFEKYKKNLDSNPYKLNIYLRNFKTIKGEIKVSLNKDKAIYVNNLLRIITPTTDLYSKLKNSLNTLINDFNIISTHMKEISILYEKLLNQSKDIKQSIDVQKLYSDLNNLFSIWSSSYLTQSKFFKNEFLEYFNYMNMEYNELDTIIDQFHNQRNEYESFANNINMKKEQLFISQDFANWGVQQGTENQIPLFQNDKKKSFEAMLYNESKVIEAEKKTVVVAINVIIQQFRKLKKYQGERVNQFYQEINKEKEKVFADCFNIIKFISKSFEEKVE